MDLSVQFESGLAHRISVTGIPANMIKEISSSIMRWARCSGISYTIERVKALKMYLIKGGDVPLGFARNRRGDLKGIFGSLIRWGHKNEKNFGKVLQALMSYTFFEFEKPTPAQKRKFRAAVSCDKPDNLSHDFHRDFALSLRRNFGMSLINRDGTNNLITYRGSDSRYRPGFGGIITRSQTSNGIVDYIAFSRIQSYRSLFKKYSSLFSPVFDGIDLARYTINDFANDVGLQNAISATNYPVYGGEVHFLMQEGGKMRSIASPHLIFQLALQPLGSAVYSKVQSLPWDCTFDQRKAVPFVQSALQKGQRCYSVDLSSATDYFPLSLQLSCLHAIFGNQPDIDLFSEISRSYWITSENDVVRWKREIGRASCRERV